MKKSFLSLLVFFMFGSIKTDLSVSSFQNKRIDFPRKYIIDAEGYWGTNAQLDLDKYEGRYPMPVVNEQSWPTEKEFLDRLALIEQHPSVEVIDYRGLSPSRLEPGKHVGNKEYVYKFNTKEIRWTEALRPYYIEKFHVIPSQEFYDFVMNFSF